ncbi:hypothetical protein [Alicyclobacillus suci]|uniref:hypothetical protein n=1 Tax=Alicyclobacillus suci TaxID=2816080 RepID=UPI001A8CBEC6|nr:hypothetical protein [Alicyclobacillus suci]
MCVQIVVADRRYGEISSEQIAKQLLRIVFTDHRPTSHAYTDAVLRNLQHRHTAEIDKVVLQEVGTEIARVLAQQIATCPSAGVYLRKIAEERLQQQTRIDKLLRQYVEGRLTALQLNQMHGLIHGRLAFLDELEAKLLTHVPSGTNQQSHWVEAHRRILDVLHTGVDVRMIRALVHTVLEGVKIIGASSTRIALRLYYRCQPPN